MWVQESLDSVNVVLEYQFAKLETLGSVHSEKIADMVVQRENDFSRKTNSYHYIT